MTENKKMKIVILAGGKGTRMNHDLPKVLVPLGGKPMIKHVIDTVKEITAEKPVLIVGHKAELVQKEFGDTCDYALQKEQLGTAHALMCAEKVCDDAKEIIVMSGDQPFVKAKTIKDSIEKFRKTKATMVLTTTVVPNFSDWCGAYLHFGRVLRKDGKIIGIREYKDASDEEKEIKEINTACCYVFNADWLWKNLKKVKNNNAKNEYYLTDLFHIASEDGEKIETIDMDPYESLGANSKEDLEVLEKFVK